MPQISSHFLVKLQIVTILLQSYHIISYFSVDNFGILLWTKCLFSPIFTGDNFARFHKLSTVEKRNSGKSRLFPAFSVDNSVDNVENSDFYTVMHIFYPQSPRMHGKAGFSPFFFPFHTCIYCIILRIAINSLGITLGKKFIRKIHNFVT